MPIVSVTMWPRTKEEKAGLVHGITKAFTSIGVPAERVIVMINELPKENWGFGGAPPR